MFATVAKYAPLLLIFRVEKREVTWSEIQRVWWLGDDRNLFLNEKLLQNKQCAARSIMVMQKPLSLPPVTLLPPNLHAEMASNTVRAVWTHCAPNCRDQRIPASFWLTLIYSIYIYIYIYTHTRTLRLAYNLPLLCQYWYQTNAWGWGCHRLPWLDCSPWKVTATLVKKECIMQCLLFYKQQWKCWTKTVWRIKHEIFYSYEHLSHCRWGVYRWGTMRYKKILYSTFKL
jgi:hypothetical protein